MLHHLYSIHDQDENDTRSMAAPSVEPRRCTPSATPYLLSGLRPIWSPPSNCASSSATPRRRRPDCSDWTPTRRFSAAGLASSGTDAARKKVEQEHVTKALADLGQQARDNHLRQKVMDLTDCSRSTAQLAIAEACRQGSILQAGGQYRLLF